jgi:acetyl esterase/lipase
MAMSSLILAVSLLATVAASQSAPRPVVKLWPGKNPEGWIRADKEEWYTDKGSDFEVVKQVSEPTLEIFKAKSAKADAPTVIVCPGGGYYVEAIEHEGWEIATRLNLAGIHAAVLKYRLPNREADKPLHKVVLQDTQRAIRLVRSLGKELGIAGGRVGILGFSAGGHATAATATAPKATYEPVDPADNLSPKPDFAVLIYPAYLNLEGTMDLAEGLHVDASTPPSFVAQAMDDPIPIEGALAYTHACHVAKVPVELHLFPKGGHGYGLRTHEPGLTTWPDLLIAWINRLHS